MESKVEGLLISKVPQGERNIIGKLLLRSGKIISVIFYGGQGGGKKMKPSVLELGYMLKIALKAGKLRNNDLFTAREWKVIWEHRKIRLNHEAYYLMCFYLEIIQKVSTPDDLYDKNRDFDQGLEGIFRVLSNGIYYLEDSLVKEKMSKSLHLSIFLSKLIGELGIAPMMEDCVFCGFGIDIANEIFLVPDHGGFACGKCIGHGSMPRGGKELYSFLKKIIMMKYKNYIEFQSTDSSINQLLIHYLSYQFNINTSNLKTIPFVL